MTTTTTDMTKVQPSTAETARTVKTDRQKTLSSFLNYKWFLYLQMADICEEEGDIDQANGWRWMYARKKYPAITPSTNTAYWHFARRNYNCLQDSLPICLNELIMKIRHKDRRGVTLSRLLVMTAIEVGKAIKKKRLRLVTNTKKSGKTS